MKNWNTNIHHVIAIGFKTRLAALFVFVTMCVAFLKVHAADPFKVKELAILYAVGALMLIAKGSGKFSLDKDL